MTNHTEVIDTSDDDLCTCCVCGSMCFSTDGGMCEVCAAEHDRDAEAAQVELDGAESDLEDLLNEMAELKDRIKDARQRVREARKAAEAVS